MSDTALKSSPYRIVSVSTWADEKVRRLTPIQPSGQGLFLMLLVGPQTTKIPGVQPVGRMAFAEMLGWDLEAFDEAFAEALREGLVEADWDARLIFVPKAVIHNPPQSINVVKSWASTWALVPECDLKRRAWHVIHDALLGISQAFADAFKSSCSLKFYGQEAPAKASAKASPKASPKASVKASPKACGKACGKAWAIQEQEQEQEQEQDKHFGTCVPKHGKPHAQNGTEPDARQDPEQGGRDASPTPPHHIPCDMDPSLRGAVPQGQDTDPAPDRSVGHARDLDGHQASVGVRACAEPAAYPPAFESAWRAMPRRMGGNPKRLAARAWSARVREGVDPDVIMAGVLRYAAFCDAEKKTGTEYVMQAATFFGPNERYLESWATRSTRRASSAASVLSEMFGDHPGAGEQVIDGDCVRVDEGGGRDV